MNSSRLATRVIASYVAAVLLLALPTELTATASSRGINLIRSGKYKALVESSVRNESRQMGFAFGALIFNASGCLVYKRLEEKSNPDEPHPLPTQWSANSYVVLPAGSKITSDGHYVHVLGVPIQTGVPRKGLPLGVALSYVVSSQKYAITHFPAGCRPPVGTNVIVLEVSVVH